MCPPLHDTDEPIDLTAVIKRRMLSRAWSTSIEGLPNNHLKAQVRARHEVWHGTRSSAEVLAEYTLHHNGHRPHQSLEQRTPDDGPEVPAPLIDLAGRRIKRGPILNGLINEFEAA